MNDRNTWTMVWRYLVLLLKVIFLIVSLLIIYGLAINFTNGYGQGIAAASIMLLLQATVICVLWKRKRRPFLLTYVLIASTILFYIFVVYTIVPVASGRKITTVTDFTNVKTQYWKLKTGSSIAYYKLEAAMGVPKKTCPIIFLHGGPGAYVRQLDINFFSMFTREGYDVYLYDQAGSGRSLLLRKEEYSHKRNVQDFEAILEKIGSEKYIAIGMSYGATLLASASTEKEISNKLYKIVYAEPGIVIKPTHDPIMPRSPSAGKDDVSMPLRLFIGILLNPRGYFTSQNEVINYFSEHKNLIQGLLRDAYPLRDSAMIPAVDVNIINFSLNGIIAPEVNKYNEKLTAEFKLHHIPSMLMMGESSYIDRNGPLDLLKEDPNIVRVQYFKGTGHLLWNGLYHNNDDVEKSILEFLSDEVPSLPNYPLTKDILEFARNRK